MATFTHWLSAARLRTLPLAFAGIMMGSFLAYYYGVFRLPVFVLALLTTLFLQVLSNLANDYGDSKSGVDSVEREGPKRAVQQGNISSNQMKKAMVLFTILSLVSGVALLLVSVTVNLTFLVFLLLGIAAIAAAIKYTVGKNPYSYSGFGDLFVFLFFGLVSVPGVFFLHTQVLEPAVFLPAISCGLLAVGVLNVNNIRDIKSDTLTGKNSIPVRIGREKAIWYHGTLLLGALISSVFFVVYEKPTWSDWLFLGPFFLIGYHWWLVKKRMEVAQIDPLLKQLALFTLLYVVLFGLGINFLSE
ncbi:MAG: 1,4-dihydroxy-2-naphthoate polyprenyltransferase [Cyclobacteriaceae bacterium]